MLEIIQAATGGGVGVAIIWALIKRPQVLAAILALVVAPFPGERVYGRYKEMAALLSAGEVPAEKTPAPKKEKRGK
jgi:hypothetical protein